MTAKIDGTNGVLQAYDYQTPTTGFSYTFAAGTQVLVMNPAGTLATGTITMPASPADGMVISASSTKAITALTVNANTGQTINNAPTTLIAGGSLSFVYRASSTSWFPFNSANVVSTYVGSGGQAFTSNGTFTIPSGITAVKVTVVGGGGGGGGGVAAGGGGGGGAAISYLTGLTSGNTLSVTIGGGGGGGSSSGGNGSSGGTSSVASGTQSITTISATGGGGGVQNSSGGAGGVGSNGTINIGGSGGSTYYGATGGSSIFGGGGVGNYLSSGGAGRAYGGGGGGVGGGCALAGGSGAAGIVIFEW